MEYQIEKMKRIDRTLLHRGAILDVYDDLMEAPDHTTEHWDFIRHRMGAAAVLPVLPNGHLLLVRQYRNAVEQELLELPAGAKNFPEEESIVCAARELEEETGYRCENLKPLIRLSTIPAFCNENLEIFLAKDLIPSKQHLDAHEYVRVEEYSLDELIRMILDQKMQDARTVAAILAYHALLQTKP